MKKRMLCMAVALIMLLTGTQLAMADAAAGTGNLYINGDFSDELNGWTYWGDMNMTVNADERAVLSEFSSAGVLHQIVPVEPGATYELSFKMMNSVEDVLTFRKDIYRVGTAIAGSGNDADDSFSTLLRNKVGTSYAFGDAKENPTWDKDAKTYKTLISVPSRYVNGLGIIMDVKADPHFAMDDVSLVKVSDSYAAIMNGNLDAGTEGVAGAWQLNNMVAETDADGNRYIRNNGTAGDFRQDSVLVPKNSTVRLSFRMKNTVANALTLNWQILTENTNGDYRVSNTEFAPLVNLIRENLKSSPISFGEAGDGSTWKDYSIDVPVPYADNGIPTPIRIFFTTAADATLCVDDFEVTYINDTPNLFMNSGFDYGTPSEACEYFGFWKGHGLLGSDAGSGLSLAAQTEANGNRYVYAVKNGANDGLTLLNSLYIEAGRYKLSFKVKAKDASVAAPKNLSVAFTLSDIAGDGYMDGLGTSSVGKTIPVSAGFNDAWETKNIYFSVKANGKIGLFLPAFGTWAEKGEYYFDDVTLTKDKTTLTFAKTSEALSIATSETAGNVSKYETVTGESFTTLKAAKDAGVTSFPVSFHYVTETPGTEEEMMLAIGVYEKDGNTKRLVDVILKSGKTVIDSVTSGANANGVICLSGEVALPETLSANHTVEVMAWKGTNTLKPYMNNQIIRYE